MIFRLMPLVQLRRGRLSRFPALRRDVGPELALLVGVGLDLRRIPSAFEESARRKRDGRRRAARHLFMPRAVVARFDAAHTAADGDCLMPGEDERASHEKKYCRATRRR